MKIIGGISRTVIGIFRLFDHTTLYQYVKYVIKKNVGNSSLGFFGCIKTIIRFF